MQTNDAFFLLFQRHELRTDHTNRNTTSANRHFQETATLNCLAVAPLGSDPGLQTGRVPASSSALGLTNSGMLVVDTIIVLHPPQSSGTSTSDGSLLPCNREDQEPCSIGAAKISKSACCKDTDRNLPPDELPVQAFTPRLVSSHARSSLCSQPKIVRHLQVPSGSERFRFEYDPLLSPSPKRSVSS